MLSHTQLWELAVLNFTYKLPSNTDTLARRSTLNPTSPRHKTARQWSQWCLGHLSWRGVEEAVLLQLLNLYFTARVFWKGVPDISHFDSAFPSPLPAFPAFPTFSLLHPFFFHFCFFFCRLSFFCFTFLWKRPRRFKTSNGKWRRHKSRADGRVRVIGTIQPCMNERMDGQMGALMDGPMGSFVYNRLYKSEWNDGYIIGIHN